MFATVFITSYTDYEGSLENFPLVCTHGNCVQNATQIVNLTSRESPQHPPESTPFFVCTAHLPDVFVIICEGYIRYRRLEKERLNGHEVEFEDVPEETPDA